MKIKTLLLLLVTAFLFDLVQSTLANAYPTASITIKAVDENGIPMEGVQAGATFEKGREYVTERGFTNKEGLFTAASENSVLDVAFGIRKDGYYESVGRYRFTMPQSGLSADRWLPWNPEVALVMKKIENPVAMYARRISVDIPVLGKEVGFDLIESDWVAPYGKGKHKDFIFKLDSSIKSQDEYEGTLSLTFPNKFDGIQLVKEDRRYGSKLKLPRHAPQKGYQKKLTKYNRRLSHDKPYEEDYKTDNNYIFHVRSEEKDGKLIRAMNGKIHGDIRFSAKYPGVSFTYYLNPDYTRNLEFDPKQNLFKNLKSTEEVGLE